MPNERSIKVGVFSLISWLLRLSEKALHSIRQNITVHTIILLALVLSDLSFKLSNFVTIGFWHLPCRRGYVHSILYIDGWMHLSTIILIVLEDSVNSGTWHQCQLGRKRSFILGSSKLWSHSPGTWLAVEISRVPHSNLWFIKFHWCGSAKMQIDSELWFFGPEALQEYSSIWLSVTTDSTI